jgi:dephospho-CoA kinase
MNPQVVCVAGGIGSGKTELSKALVARLGWRRAAFGDFVRSVARARALGDGREVLQQLGEALLKQDAEGFCRSVLADTKWKQGEALVLEGIRHAEVLELIRRIVAPTPVTFIYLSVPDAVRADRLAGRTSDDAAQLEKLDQHSTEVQVKSFDQLADLTLDGEATLDSWTEQAVAFLESR